jgi:uncharacterized protein (TIGR02246 family)
MRPFRLPWALALLSMVPACRPQPVTPDGAMGAVRAADSALTMAMNSRDVERVMHFYAPEATLLPEAKPVIVGRDAIRAEWAGLFAIPAFNSTARTLQVDVARGGDMAFTRGSYETLLTGQDGKPVTELGKWVTIWRKQADGSWRIIVEIYNTDTPPPDHI